MAACRQTWCWKRSWEFCILIWRLQNESVCHIRDTLSIGDLRACPHSDTLPRRTKHSNTWICGSHSYSNHQSHQGPIVLKETFLSEEHAEVWQGPVSPCQSMSLPLYQPHRHAVHHLLWCPLACRLSVARFTKRLKWESNVVIRLYSLCELSYCAHAIDAHIYLSEKKQYINRLQLLFLAIKCIQRGDSDPSWKNRPVYKSRFALGDYSKLSHILIYE